MKSKTATFLFCAGLALECAIFFLTKHEVARLGNSPDWFYLTNILLGVAAFTLLIVVARSKANVGMRIVAILLSFYPAAVFSLTILGMMGAV